MYIVNVKAHMYAAYLIQTNVKRNMKIFSLKFQGMDNAKGENPNV